MSSSIEQNSYNKLLVDITALCDQAHKAMVEAYWQIGKRIVEQERQAQGLAPQGTQLLVQLSLDLQERLGSGFSVRNLRNMRRFFLDNKCPQTAAELTWSQHVELMPIKNPSARSKLKQRIVRHMLSTQQIRQAVRKQAALERKKRTDTRLKKKQTAAVAKLPCVRGALQTYSIVDRDRVSYPKGCVVIDCGFNIWRPIPRKEVADHETPSYTYAARVLSVIDGDTLWAIADLGWGMFTRQKFRLHQIDTPELGTSAGERARRFVAHVLQPNSHIVIRTHKYDKYARYLADVFYLPGVKQAKRISTKGIFLNQQLLDKGLARVWST